MKVVILAGGMGSRISEESHLRPKPMIEVGGMPILWHIMKGYSRFGFNDFVICAGYKQHMIKEWFADYFLHTSDVTFDWTGGEENVTVHDTSVEPWRVTVADTGLSTLTAGRVLQAEPYVGSEDFMLTYGDGVSDVDPNDVLATHRRLGTTVTVTGVVPRQRFGVIDVARDGRVGTFREKGTEDSALVNGGFMACTPGVFDAIREAGTDPGREDFSAVTLEWLASREELGCHRYEGFWACMDTQRDRQALEELWESGEAPWRVW